jgi:hypothetical protein
MARRLERRRRGQKVARGKCGAKRSTRPLDRLGRTTSPERAIDNWRRGVCRPLGPITSALCDPGAVRCALAPGYPLAAPSALRFVEPLAGYPWPCLRRGGSRLSTLSITEWRRRTRRLENELRSRTADAAGDFVAEGPGFGLDGGFVQGQ